MEDILIIISGLLIGAGIVYFIYFLFSIYGNIRLKLLRKKVKLPDLNFLEEQLTQKAMEVEDDLNGDYESDPDGKHRFNQVDTFAEHIIKLVKLDHIIDKEDRKKLIKYIVKGAGLVKGKNPYKK